ncbi:MAG: hypothetical protein QOD36_363 [Mycobacterium sp.]|jgi:hypothetical protein|nr:hypothetical protein [Mycobacterium sp.]MDT5242987.1 hypothetical protein [Mycobacterium sp.]
MTRFHDQDLTGARFERANLRDAQSKGVDLTGVRMRGVELVDVAPPHAGAGDGFREAASAAWVARMVRGTASPWHPLDLPWDEAPGWDGIPWDPRGPTFTR